MTETTKETQVWLYVGMAITGDKRDYVWEDEDGVRRYFGKLVVKDARPGASYELEVTPRDDGGISVGIQRYGYKSFKGMCADTDRLAQLQTNDKAAQVAWRQRNEAKADMKADAVGEILKPLAAEYMRRNHTGRAALIATVIEYITRTGVQA